MAHIHPDEAWLKSEPNWTPKSQVGKGWVAKRVLGKGGFGIAGLWSYEGSDKDSKILTKVVVKQGQVLKRDGGLGKGLRREADMLKLLGASKSPHIIKMFRHMYRDIGHGTMDMDQGVVHRLYLEYCPGGDLYEWFDHRRLNKIEISEAELWAVFHCLALGTLAIHHGSEDTKLDRWDRDEICHFDLKYANVFLGEETTDTEHKNMPVFKIADFGLAKEVPSVQDEEFLSRYKAFGTKSWATPEQVTEYTNFTYSRRPWVNIAGSKVTNIHYGTPSNIWQVGMIMWCLMRREAVPPWYSMQTYHSTMSRTLKIGGETLGQTIDIDEGAGIGPKPEYSQWLRSVISECILIQPSSRPTPEKLVEKTRRGLESSRMVAGTFNIVPDQANPVPSIKQEPKLSDKWYSASSNGASQDQDSPTVEHETLNLFDLLQARVEIEAKEKGAAEIPPGAPGKGQNNPAAGAATNRGGGSLSDLGTAPVTNQGAAVSERFQSLSLSKTDFSWLLTSSGSEGYA